MYDKAAADKFINSLFANILTHLDRINNESNAALTPLAHLFIQSQNQQHRLAYLEIADRVETLKAMCEVMLEDHAVSPEVQGKISMIFPDLAPPAQRQDPAPADKPNTEQGPAPSPTSMPAPEPAPSVPAEPVQAAAT